VPLPLFVILSNLAPVCLIFLLGSVYGVLATGESRDANHIHARTGLSPKGPNPLSFVRPVYFSHIFLPKGSFGCNGTNPNLDLSLTGIWLIPVLHPIPLGPIILIHALLFSFDSPRSGSKSPHGNSTNGASSLSRSRGKNSTRHAGR
jgi:hypothetical protein